jgi:hypothetical protein
MILVVINNAIGNSINNIFRKTAENFRTKQQLPQTPCPRCGLMMTLQPMPNGRMAMWHCVRCKFNQVVQLQ